MNLDPLLLGNALALGFRHGIDWDHLAAIMDIVSAVSTDKTNDKAGALILQKRVLTLSSFYALGHALVVIMLGIAALSFAATLPKWIDPIMERVVGLTLVAFGLWVSYMLYRFLSGKQELQLKSRWMLTFTAVQQLINWAGYSKLKHEHHPVSSLKGFSRSTAFGVGMLHGIGAETGTQVLLIASISGVADQLLGLGMLAVFIIGLILSNTIVALLGCSGFILSANFKPIYITAGALTAFFSLTVGSLLMLGLGEHLPNLQQISNRSSK